MLKLIDLNVYGYQYGIGKKSIGIPVLVKKHSNIQSLCCLYINLEINCEIITL